MYTNVYVVYVYMYSQIHTQIIYHYFGSSFSQKQNIKKVFLIIFRLYSLASKGILYLYCAI